MRKIMQLEGSQFLFAKNCKQSNCLLGFDSLSISSKVGDIEVCRKLRAPNFGHKIWRRKCLVGMNLPDEEIE